MSKVTVLVPAAGTGRRMGNAVAKQFLLLGDKPLLAHTLLAFQRSPDIDEIVPILSEDERESCLRNIIEAFHITKCRVIVAGGRERQDSVYNAVRQLGPDAGVVLVHDGVRPFVTQELIHACVAAARKGECVAAGMPPKDTIKEADERGIVRRTLDRSRLWSIQTPQAFPAEVLREAYDRSYRENYSGTDDATLVERAGREVRVIRGSYENIKITTPEDLVLAEGILKRR